MPAPGGPDSEKRTSSLPSNRVPARWAVRTDERDACVDKHHDGRRVAAVPGARVLGFAAAVAIRAEAVRTARGGRGRPRQRETCRQSSIAHTRLLVELARPTQRLQMPRFVRGDRALPSHETAAGVNGSQACVRFECRHRARSSTTVASRAGHGRTASRQSSVRARSHAGPDHGFLLTSDHRNSPPRYQVTPVILGQRQTTQLLPVRLASTHHSGVSLPPTRDPTGSTGQTAEPMPTMTLSTTLSGSTRSGHARQPESGVTPTFAHRRRHHVAVEQGGERQFKRRLLDLAAATRERARDRRIDRHHAAQPTATTFDPERRDNGSRNRPTR